MELAYLFLAAYILDLILGDPQGWPHPVRFMGLILDFWEKTLYKPSVWAGVFFYLAILASVSLFLVLIMEIAGKSPAWVAALVVIYLLYSLFATRCLHQESRPVEMALARGDLAEARLRLSSIVSRETAHLTPEEIRRANLETVAENLSDGVVAPLFFTLLLGLPGLVLYKMANTADSMVGYKNERYLAFGRLAARIDDGLNYLPARLCALLLVAAAYLLRLDGPEARRILVRDRNQASSPNAGWPEAAMAGALGVRLGGPNVYFGQVVAKPYIGDPGHTLSPLDYKRAIRLLYLTSFLMAMAVFLLLAWSRANLWGLFGLGV